MQKITNINLFKIDTNKKYTLSTFFLLVSIFFAPFRIYGLFSLGGMTITFFRASSFFLFISLFLELLIENGKIRIDKIKIVLFLILLSLLISVTYSPNLSGGVSNFNSMLFSIIWIFMALVVFELRPDIITSSLKIIIVSSFIPIFIGFYQSYYYNINGVFPVLPFNSLLTITRTEVNYNIFARATSTFSDPSYYATFLSIINIISLGLFLEDLSLLKQIRLKRISCLIVYLITIIALFQTLSISGLIGMITGTCCLLILKKRLNNGLIIFMIVFLLITFVLLTEKSSLLETLNFKISNTSIDKGISGRDEYIKNALGQFIKNPLFGAGFGGLLIPGASFSSAHNSILTVLGQQGIIAFILNTYILMYLPTSSIIKIRKLYSEYSSTAIIIYSSYISMIIISMGYDILYKMDNTAVMIAIMLSSTNISFSNNKDNIMVNHKNYNEE